MELLIFGKYRIGRLLKSGSHGDVYRGVNKVNDTDVAIKLEPIRRKLQTIAYEWKAYVCLGMVPGHDGTVVMVMVMQYHMVEHIPRTFWHGITGDYNVIVLEMLGPSLADVLGEVGVIPLRTVVMIAIQMVCNTMHRCTIIPD